MSKIKNKRPPIGVMSWWLSDEKRLKDVKSAIGRYKKAGLSPLREWEDEVELIKERLSQKTTGSKILLTSSRMSKLISLTVYNKGQLKHNDDISSLADKATVNPRMIAHELYNIIEHLHFSKNEFCTIFNVEESTLLSVFSQKFWDLLPPNVNAVTVDSRNVWNAYGSSDGIKDYFSSDCKGRSLMQTMKDGDEPNQYWGFKSKSPPIIKNLQSHKQFSKFILEKRLTGRNTCQEAIFERHNLGDFKDKKKNYV